MRSSEGGTNPLFVSQDFSIYPRDLERAVYIVKMFRIRFLESGIATPEEVSIAEKATVEDLAYAHTLVYIDDVMNLRKTRRTLFCGFSLGEFSRDVSLINVGGTVKAAEIALEAGIAMHLTGGTVYAHRDYASSLSYFNDAAIAMLKNRVLGRINRGLVVSSDAYSPEGTISILSSFPEFHTLSIFDESNRTQSLPKGDQDITVSWNTGDEEYLKIIEGSVLRTYDVFKPEFVVYLSSAKIQNEGPDGGFTVTTEALEKRDRVVIGGACERRIPIVVLTAGGRTRELEDYISIHINTARIVKEFAQKL
jgi:acetoin utilization deacetylase AcuC-like enzyme